MKKKIAALAIMLCVVGTSPAFARGNNHGNYDGYHNRSNYYNKSDYRGHRSGGHHNNVPGIAFGIVGGLLLGSALLYSAPPAPPPVFYSTPYQPVTVIQQPSICVQDQIVNGQWETSQYNDRRVWVSFPRPITQRVQVPCY
ncbi:MAG: hypothetical protein ACI8ZB_002503 [Desulforhopalus sp.]|jgi:hypothetical protein